MSSYLMGEEGYSLTTFQTALAYLESLEGTEQCPEDEPLLKEDSFPREEPSRQETSEREPNNA